MSIKCFKNIIGEKDTKPNLSSIKYDAKSVIEKYIYYYRILESQSKSIQELREDVKNSIS